MPAVFQTGKVTTYFYFTTNLHQNVFIFEEPVLLPSVKIFLWNHFNIAGVSVAASRRRLVIFYHFQGNLEELCRIVFAI